MLTILFNEKSVSGGVYDTRRVIMCNRERSYTVNNQSQTKDLK